MNIKKRNGRLVQFNPQKLLQRCRGYNTDVDIRTYIDKAVIDCQGFFYDEISTREIDHRLAQCCSQLAIYEPEMAYLGGYILLSSLKKDIENNSFSYLDNPKLTEHFRVRFTQFTKPVVDELPMTYFAANTFINEFSLKDDNGNPTELPSDSYWRVAVTLGDNNQSVNNYFFNLYNRKISMSNPILVNAGTNMGKLISCTTLSIGNDTRESILEAMNSSATHSSNNSGVGIYIGDTRSKLTSRSKGGTASGIRSLVKMFPPISSFFCQNGKRRRGAFAMYCDLWHRDIEDFIPMKRPDLPPSVTDLNGFYAVCIPDLFYKRFEEGGNWTLMCPEEVRREYSFNLSDYWGKEFEDFYTLIEEEATIPNLKTIPAADLMMQLVDTMASSGVPYIFNRDRANDGYQQSYEGTIKSQQLCVSGDTLLMTDEGEFPIQDLVGQVVNVWNGKEFTPAPVFKTGYSEKLFRVATSSGIYLDCTKHHKWYINVDGEENIIPTKKLRLNDIICDYSYPANIIDFGAFGECKIHPLPNKNQKIIGITELDGLHNTYCVTESKTNKATFNGLLTGNCNEFLGFHNEEYEAQCCLSSIPLPYHIENGEFNFKSLASSVKTLTRLLNKVIDVNEFNTEKATRSGLKHRNIGIGIVGLADVFAILNYTYGDEESRKLNNEIQKTIYLSALEESNKIAKETGLGKFETEVVKNTPDWIPIELKNSLKQYGVMNDLLCCNMPTSTTSKLLDITQSFEVFDFPISYRQTIMGEFKIVNKYLVNDLKKENLWNSDTIRNLLKHNNVDMIDGCPNWIKDKYIDKYRHSNKVYLEMAADRQKYIDQGQSMNLYYELPERNKISTSLYYGWKLGLPSGSYYTTVLSRATGTKDTVAEIINFEKPKDSPFECFGCGS